MRVARRRAGWREARPAILCSFIGLLIVIAMAALPLEASASGRYDPRLRFKTIWTPRFDIHYHQGELQQARRLAWIAEKVAAELDTTIGRATGRVQVILVNQSDLSNGWATPLPFNTIEIGTATPAGTSFIGNTDDWLRLVFTHEYTHIVHLSRGRGWIGGLRRAFGRMPLLYPNLFLPAWQIEGLAVYEESAITGQGRVPDRNFRAIVNVAAAEARLEPLDRANGGLVDWPGGHTPYAYGAYFHEFLAARYGEATLAKLTDATAGRIPYFGSPAFKKVFNRSLGELWREFEAEARPRLAPERARVTRLTMDGFSVGGPRFAPDGRLWYSVVDPHGFPSLRARDADGTSRTIARRYLGTRLGFAGTRAVFDQMEVENQVGLQSDLYAVELTGAEVTRLTHGARAADPDVSPDGRTIVCTIQREDRRDLATLGSDRGQTGVRPGSDQGQTGVRPGSDPLTAVPTALVSEPNVHFAAPRWSPDARWIAVERVSLGRRSEIVLVDPATGRIARTVASSRASRSVAPAWTPDGQLLFASDRAGDGFQIYRTDVNTGVTWRLEDSGPNSSSPEPSRDGQTLVFVGYTPAGNDLFSLPLQTARWAAVEPEGPLAAPEPEHEVIKTHAERPSYSPWRTIAPRFWTPTIESDEGEIVVGAATGGTDALGRHAYAVEAGWTASRGRPDWQIAYAYDRWRPTLFANVADDTDPWRDGEARTIEGNAGVLVPFRRVRWTQALFGAFHSSVDEIRCSGCDTVENARAVRRSSRAGWLVDAARSYGYSISREEGWLATLTTEMTHEALGADGDGQAATLDVRFYKAVRPRHAVIAVRAAAAGSWGDDQVRRLFTASGNGPQGSGFDVSFDAIGLIRGLGEDELIGTRAAVANLDYRIPIVRVDRGLGTLPAFVRVVHGAVFADLGHAWTDTFRRRDTTLSIGGELSLDTVLGYSLPLTFTAGAAWVNRGRGVAVFGRIGKAY